MFLIKECKKRKNTYEKYLVDRETDKKRLIKTVHVRSVHRDYNTREYTILYDSNMNPIKDAFEFLNYEFLTSSPNTKSQVVSALRLLYSFLELFDLKIESLTDENINNLKYFLKGYSPNGNFISIDLDTDRSNSTINIYLSFFRKYAEFLNIQDSNLSKISPIKNKSYVSKNDGVMVETKSYVHNERVKRNKGVPKYISLPEYKKILEVIDKEYSLREKCMVRLMFEGGLRIGEVLGLTSEDIKIETFLDKRTQTNFEAGVIYFRNRITDKEYQLAKRRMPITTRRTYRTKAYRDDTTKTFISLELIDLIFEYMNTAHDSYNRKTTTSKKLFDKNYKNYTVTDIVDKRGNIDEDGYPILDENCYVFINSIGKPLSITLWNRILRQIYTKCNIKLDRGKKENNLSHRLRHGFAMFLVQYKRIKIEDLMKLMRHVSILSTEKYYNPTDDDIALIKEDFSKEIEELMPIVLERSFDEYDLAK